jgi:hypothetical protein
VTMQILDAPGNVIYSASGQPGAGVARPPSPVPAAASGRGGRGGGRGAFFAEEGAPPEATTEEGRGGQGGERGQAGRGGQAGQGGQGGRAGEAAQAGRGRGGRGGFFGGGGAVVSAHEGLNRTTWNARLQESPFTIPEHIVMWGGGGGRGGAGGPKAAPATYTVKITAGAWTGTQTFKLSTDPRLPPMTEAEGAEQLKMTLEVGKQVKQLYDTLATIRDVKKQAADSAAKADAKARMEAAAKTLTDKLVAIEGDLTQLQGEGGQDALNFPGRLDNQWIALYGSVSNGERKINSGMKERLADLKPQTDALLQRAAKSLKDDVAAVNAAAKRARVPEVVVKQ